MKKYVFYILIAVLATVASCKKFLDEKPDKSASVITSIKDLQALLDDPLLISSYNSLTTGGADEYYFNDASWQSKDKAYRDAYIWEGTTDVDAWSQPYQIVFQCNVVLDRLGKISGSDAEKNYIMGQALFHRAFAFFQVAQLYCPVYSNETLNENGIVLRLSPDVEAKSVRSTVKETYDRILDDLGQAVNLLPGKTPALNRPSNLSAFGMLSRVYLSMSDYLRAEQTANSYLKISDELVDYNEVDTTLNPGISQSNKETSYFAYMDGFVPGDNGIADTLLLKMYDKNDLRRPVYYFDPGDGNYYFKGSYSGLLGYFTFCGIASDEVYLNRAECFARRGNIPGAMIDLNRLLEKRWLAGTFTPLTANSKEEAIDLVLRERRKELVYRGTRWTDIRRLNKEGANIVLTRIIEGRVHTLPANDNRYTWLIPREVIQLAGIPQNKR